MTLTVALMTRGRPDTLRNTLARTLPNIARKDTKLLVLVDEDDTATKAALGKTNFAGHPNLQNLRYSINQREDTRGQKYDRALKEARADVYLPICDYAPIVTPGFDQLILDAAGAFPDGIGVVYTQMANMSFPAYQAMTAKLVAKLGYIYPPWFPFWFIDHWMDDLARMIGRIAFADVACPAVIREGGHKTIGLRDLEFWTTLYDAGRDHRRRQATAIIEGQDFIEEPWRKQVLISNFPLHEHRSLCINNGVRADAARIEQYRGGVESEPDERYQRIKGHAEQLMHKWAGDFIHDKRARIVADIAQAAWDHNKERVTTLMHEWKAVA